MEKDKGSWLIGEDLGINPQGYLVRDTAGPDKDAADHQSEMLKAIKGYAGHDVNEEPGIPLEGSRNIVEGRIYWEQQQDRNTGRWGTRIVIGKKGKKSDRVLGSSVDPIVLSHVAFVDNSKHALPGEEAATGSALADRAKGKGSPTYLAEQNVGLPYMQ